MNIIHIMDKIRDENHMSISKLCEGICSTRSYYRYRDENHDVPKDILESLCSRLNITVKELYSLYHEKTNPIYVEVHRLNFYIQKEDLVNSKKIIDSLDESMIDNPMYINLFNYLKLKYQFMGNHIHIIDYYDRLKGMISTQHISFDSFSSLDLMVLFEMAKIELKDPSKNYFATYQLSDALLNINLATITNDTIHMILPVYELIISYENKRKNYKHALALSYKGLELSNKYYSMQSLRSFYYIIGKISLQEHDDESAEENFTKCLYITAIKDNKEMFDLFKGYIVSMLKEAGKDDMIDKINLIRIF